MLTKHNLGSKKLFGICLALGFNLKHLLKEMFNQRSHLAIKFTFTKFGKKKLEIFVKSVKWPGIDPACKK